MSLFILATLTAPLARSLVDATTNTAKLERTSGVRSLKPGLFAERDGTISTPIYEPEECDSWTSTLVASDENCSDGVSESEYHAFLSSIEDPPYIAAYFEAYERFDQLPWVFRVVHKTLACHCEKLGFGEECCEGDDAEIMLQGLENDGGVSTARNRVEEDYRDSFCQQIAYVLSKSIPSPAPTDGPTLSPTESPSASPSASPSVFPSMLPSATPTCGPTDGPTASPTETPSIGPTASPSMGPSAAPTGGPTDGPTESPSAYPTVSPSTVPTGGPTDGPTLSPTKSPTVGPTRAPSMGPSAAPTGGPTDGPTASPSKSPSAGPSASPSIFPSTFPSATPTGGPTDGPTIGPTASPSDGPTASPSTGPTMAPTTVLRLAAIAPPEERDNDPRILLIVGVGLACLVLLVAILFIAHRRRANAPTEPRNFAGDAAAESDLEAPPMAMEEGDDDSSVLSAWSDSVEPNADELFEDHMEPGATAGSALAAIGVASTVAARIGANNSDHSGST